MIDKVDLDDLRLNFTSLFNLLVELQAEVATLRAVLLQSGLMTAEQNELVQNSYRTEQNLKTAYGMMTQLFANYFEHNKQSLANPQPPQRPINDPPLPGDPDFLDLNKVGDAT